MGRKVQSGAVLWMLGTVLAVTGAAHEAVTGAVALAVVAGIVVAWTGALGTVVGVSAEPLTGPVYMAVYAVLAATVAPMFVTGVAVDFGVVNAAAVDTLMLALAAAGAVTALGGGLVGGALSKSG